MDAMIRWVCRGVSLLVLGPIAAWAAGGVRAPDGSSESTLLTGTSLVGGVIALVIVGVCVLLASGISALASDRHEAVLNSGFVMGWVAWTAGRLGEVFRMSPEAGTLVLLATEAAALGAVVVASWILADRLSRRAPKDEGLSLSGRDLTASVVLKAGVPTMAVSLVLGMVCVWLFARHDAPGQALGAAFIAGVGAGVFGSLVHQSVMQDQGTGLPGLTAVFVAVMLGLLLAGVIAPVVGLAMPGSGKLLAGVARGNLPGWVLVSPSAWAAGALIGVPAGLSFLQSGSQNAREAGVPVRV